MDAGFSLMKAEVRDFAMRHKLSAREHDVVLVLASGTATVQAIAEQMGRSQNTIHNHLKSVFRKTGTAGKTEVLALLLRHSLERQANRHPLVKHPKVLIVDDERPLGEGLRRMLERRGIAAVYEPDPHRALERLEEAPVDVAVVDVEMPAMSGLAFVERVRQVSPHRPALFVMTGASHPDADHCIALGAQAFFRKPVDADELAFCVFEHCVDSPYELSRFVRVEAALSVRVDDAVELFVGNIGFGGIFIPLSERQSAAPAQFQIGQRVRLEIRLDEGGKPLHVAGEVVWQRAALRPREACPFERSGVGIRFVELEGSAKAAIEAFVRRRKLVAIAPWPSGPHASERISA